MPQYDSSRVRVDDAEEEVFGKIQDRIDRRVIRIHVLRKELRARATGGDLLEMDAYTERELANLEARLRGEVELASSNGESKSPSTITSAEVNALVIEFGTWWLQLHMGLEAEARASQSFYEDMRNGGVLLIQLCKELVEQRKANPNDFTTVDGHLVPRAWAEEQAHTNRLQGAFDQVAREVLGSPTGDSVYLASKIVETIKKLRALPSTPVNTVADEVFTLLTADLDYNPSESAKKYLERVERMVQREAEAETSKVLSETSGIPMECETLKEYTKRVVQMLQTRAKQPASGNYTQLLDEIGTAIGCPRNTAETDDALLERVKLRLTKVMGDSEVYWQQHASMKKYCDDNSIAVAKTDTPYGMFVKVAEHWNTFASAATPQKGGRLKAAAKTVMTGLRGQKN